MTGDPSQEGLYVLLVRLPAGYEVPAHTHPNGEIVTVLSGNLNLSHSEAPSRETGEVLPAGSVVATPADHPLLAHLVWANEETVIEVAGEGPFEIEYLNPEEDPRGAEQPSSN